MSNASLRPSKLKNHRGKKHPQRKNDDIDALSANRVRYDLEAALSHFGFTVEENSTFQFSYEVAYQIKKCKKLHIIAEEFMNLCAENMIEIMIDSGAIKKINDDTLHVSWYRDPYNNKINLNAEETEELAEFKVSNAMKLAFNNKTDDSIFWLSLHDSHPLLSKKSSVILV